MLADNSDGSALMGEVIDAGLSSKAARLKNLIFRCGLTLGFLLVPAIVTMALKSHPALNPIISISFVIAISAAAWWGGALAGILATCAAIPVLTLAATGGKAFLPPHVDLLGIGIFCFISLLVSRIATNRKRIEQVLRSANAQLESRVEERTADLQYANAAIQRANTELQRREEQFRTLANAIPQLCWMTDGVGSVLWCNERWSVYTGAKLEHLQNSDWRGLHHPDTLPGVVERWQNCLATDEPFEMEFLLRSCDGHFRWFLTRILPVSDETGKTVRWFGTATDIEKLKEMEEHLRRANSDLQQFAYSASHDLQEPIRMVSIYSQLIGRQYGSKLDGNGQLFLEYLITAAQRMEKLVRDLLFYTQTGSIDISDSETADAQEVLKEVLANLSAVVIESGACVTSDPLPTLKMRAVHLQQLFQNLIGNGIKYRGDKPPSIHISAREQNDCWLLSVQDNGIGIDPVYKERIFGIFKRLHTNDKYSGTGIGLAICQRIIERYRGRIWIESEPGKGSTFFFTIPV